MRFCVVKILSADSRKRMERVLGEALHSSCVSDDLSCVFIETPEEFRQMGEEGRLKNIRIIFAVELDRSGINIDAYRILEYLNRRRNSGVMEGSFGSVIIDGEGELYTKDMGRRLVFAANAAGCGFPGKPLVEATGELKNFKVISSLWGMEAMEAYVKSCKLLIAKLLEFGIEKKQMPQILAIHASNRKTSNSLCLWEMVADDLRGKADIEEISIRNGEVWDCRGCKYEDCLHFGENSGCFYGGVMVEKVYPAIIRSDVLVLICPNYNDAVSANIMAFINRLTAVFRANDFSRKRVYAIVVSGYSGGDIVAQQVISAINMNKNFILPGKFALMETANDPGDVEKIEAIRKRTKKFAENILSGI